MKKNLLAVSVILLCLASFALSLAIAGCGSNATGGGGSTGGASVTATGEVYITDFLNKRVLVLLSSGESFIQVATIELTGATTPKWMAMNPSGTKLYVADDGANKVFVINTATNTVEAAVVVCTGPKGMAFNTDASELYVATPGSADISMIDTSNDTHNGDIEIGTTNFSNLAWGNVYGQLLIANTGLNSIEVVNIPDSGASISYGIPVPAPYQIVASSTTELPEYAYTTSYDPSAPYLSKVNIVARTIEHTWESSAASATPTAFHGFRGLVISPDNKKLYAADHDFSYIDGMGITTIETMSPIKYISGAASEVPGPEQIAIYPDGKYLAILNSYNTEEVVLLDTVHKTRVGSYVLPYTASYFGIVYKP